jgi:hypothetical protein
MNVLRVIQGVAKGSHLSFERFSSAAGKEYQSHDSILLRPSAEGDC